MEQDEERDRIGMGQTWYGEDERVLRASKKFSGLR